MTEKRNLKRLYILIGIMSWLGLTVIDSPILFNAFIEAASFWASFTKNTFLGTLTISILLFYKLEIDNNEKGTLNDMFWKLSVSGFVITLLLTSDSVVQVYLSQIWPEIALGLVSMIEQGIIAITLIFIISCFYVFKRLILYQKSKEILSLWRVFECMIYLSPICNYFNFLHNEVVFQLLALPYILLALILCYNLKWIAYLNVKQKWKDIVFLSIILMLTLVLAWNIINFSIEHALVTDLTNNVLIITLFTFVSVYSLLSILVLLFNLPTSSVFERKFGEVMQFQKLSKSVQIGKTEEEVYHLLIESCSSTLMATGAILEQFDESGNTKTIIYRNLDQERHLEIANFNRSNTIQVGVDYFLVDDLSKLSKYDEIGYMGYASMLILPLSSFTEKYGNLYLFSEIKQGFEKEMIEIVNTYVAQACTSISNLRLIQQAVSQARYMRDREIAKRVQLGLLPSQLLNNQYIEMAAVSISADEVGGDYYDFTTLSDTRFVIVIGDVSGKGTSAAFHMAKLKGVFHSLATLDLPSDTFMKHANVALSACLDKATFVTLSLLVFDFEKKMLSTCRAGHCPTLYFHQDTNQVEFIEQKGLGLAINRNHPYSIDFDVIEIPLKKGDIILLYTDGITEATNAAAEEFGSERILHFLQANNQFGVEEIKSNLLNTVQMHCGSKINLDDYSLMLIKVK
ncbi:MAG: GAF domain-containing SpoIIE family protein phosphatase [Cytophagales bacterium]